MRTWIITVALVVAACGKAPTPESLCRDAIAVKQARGELGGISLEAARAKCTADLEKMRREQPELYAKMAPCIQEKLANPASTCDRDVVEFARANHKDPGDKGEAAVRRLYAAIRAAGTAGALPTASVGPTPPLGTCCAGDGAPVCAPDAARWSDPTWQALKFSVAEPDAYSYVYKVAPGGGAFTALAYGDLDCDEIASTFAITGALAAPAGLAAEPPVASENAFE